MLSDLRKLMIIAHELNLTSKELDRDVEMKGFIDRELKEGEKEEGETVGEALVENGKLEAKIRVINHQFGYRYDWNLETAENRQYMIRDLLE